ncbi:hypothetical protein FQR65_LT14417 [Abscondita terminalis]|nr:hypothetical protein FQR65_LT14417 [Abscondita terminalis]
MSGAEKRKKRKEKEQANISQARFDENIFSKTEGTVGEKANKMLNEELQVTELEKAPADEMKKIFIHKMTNRLDVVLFGATGYTGKYGIEYVHKLLKEKHYTWGIAGRSETKLKQTLAEYQKTTDDDLSNVPILVADVNDVDALKAMTARAKIIINCCGPYRFYGEPVVKACIETGTHQVDVCGEPQYMEYIQYKYHEAAKEKGVYILSACGFDSIPCDLGLLYTAQNFGGTLNSAEIYFQMQSGHNTSGFSINYGTWESLVHSVTHAHELRELRSKLYPTPMPSFSPKLKPNGKGWKEKLSEADDSYDSPPTDSIICKVSGYDPGYGVTCSAVTLAAIVILEELDKLPQKVRHIFFKHPKVFSLGLFSREGPSKQAMQSASFSMTFSGKGWKEKLSEADDSYDSPPTDSIICKVSGYDPGYGVTCSAVTLAAIVILEELDKLPQNGGVYSPGAAFYDTSLLNKLQNHCLTFEVVNKS